MELNKTLLDDAKALKELLSTESRWTQKELARGSDGQGRSPTDSKATCWCMLGGIRKVTHDPTGSTDRTISLNNLVREAIGVVGGLRFPYIPDFNDGHDHSDIVVVLEKTVELAEAA